MRTALAVALALSLSLAVVRANETPEPVLYDAVAPVAEPSSDIFAEDLPSNPAEPVAPTPSDSSDGYRPANPQPGMPQPATPKVCVMLKAKSFEINTDSAPRPMSAEPIAYLLCDNVQTTSSAGGATTLKCTNCKVTLPNGVSATANDVAYDTKTNMLILNGSDKSPVTVTLNGTETKTAKAEMKIDPSSWRSNAPFGTQVQSTSYVLPSTSAPTPSRPPVPSPSRNN